MSHPILREVEAFCESELLPYLEEHHWTPTSSTPLHPQMAKLGLFGAAIAPDFGGGKFPPPMNIAINRILSKYWLAIPAVYGIHSRASQYLSRYGSNQQANDYLPAMASGEMIGAHAYHEKSKRDPLEFETRLYEDNGKYFLSGRKEWVLNAAIADLIVVIAKNTINGGCSAVLLTKNMTGLNINEEHHRRGLTGVSLTAVDFDRIEVTAADVIGGLECDVTEVACGYQPVPLLNFASRATGVAESLVQQTQQHLCLERKDTLSTGALHYQWGHIRMLQESIQAHFEYALSQHRDGILTKATAYRTKAACSMALAELVKLSSRICGGNGYVGHDGRLIRLLNDAESLCYIDTPDDILLSLSAREELAR